jgi:hypothetical protein
MNNWLQVACKWLHNGGTETSLLYQKIENDFATTAANQCSSVISIPTKKSKKRESGIKDYIEGWLI